jgi:hypothetical protein
VTGGINTKPRNSRLLLGIVSLVVVLLVAGGVGLIRDHKQTSSSQSGWAEYKNDKNGLKIEYPASWGAPSFQSNDFTKGKRYTFLFTASTIKSVSITLDTQDLEQKICVSETSCKTIPPVTSKSIESYNSSAQSSVGHDSSSYYLLYDAAPDRHILENYKSVSLPKHNVTAVLVSYGIENKTKCSDKQLAVKPGNCISEQEYNAVAPPPCPSSQAPCTGRGRPTR